MKVAAALQADSLAEEGVCRGCRRGCGWRRCGGTFGRGLCRNMAAGGLSQG